MATYNRGKAAYKQDDFQEAIKQYTQAIDLDPSYANAYVSRGVAYEGLGEAQNAE
ncbi:MAG: tetratricopeptide repeat protein, partial [Helicobacteraceae bacterium]|nr:tetratricopeptide repeat protein [Helicobacteraceae bacterium]